MKIPIKIELNKKQKEKLKLKDREIIILENKLEKYQNMESKLWEFCRDNENNLLTKKTVNSVIKILNE